MKCNATLLVRDVHECTREAGHPMSASVWQPGYQAHICGGYEWVDGAEGSMPHTETPARAGTCTNYAAPESADSSSGGVL